MKNPIFFIFTFSLLLIPAVCSAKIIKRNAVLMGTDIELIASVGAESDDAKVDMAFDLAIREMERIENEMSEWKEGTYVSRINQNAGGEAVVVPSELFNVISAAQKVSELSEGAFDISWAAMRGLWKFSKGEERVPSAEEISGKLQYVNYRDIDLNEIKKTVVLKKHGMAIGLGGIAKGFAVDKAMDILVKQGITDAIIKSGGDMRIQGKNDGMEWDIGIQHPRDKNKVLAALHLSNISVSTSGDYERFFIKDGILYHHIIDPKTGMPARGCMSVTILAPDTMTSDALSTAVFVLGPEKGLQLIQSLPGIEGIIVDSSGKIHSSQGIDRKDF